MMNSELLKNIAIEDLTEESHIEMAEIIGIESFLKLADYYGGAKIHIPKLDTVMRSTVKKLIRKEFCNGATTNELVRKYKISDSSIRRYIKEGMKNGR